MLKKLDSFTLKSFLGPFIMTFLIVMFVLVMQFLWLYIDELVGKGLSFLVILEFLGWGSATLMPLALPLATLLASIMTLGDFGENNELLAMKAAGISLPRILAPLVIVAFIISIGAFFASNNLIPIAYDNIYTLRDDIGRTKEEIKIPSGIFYNGIEGYTLRVENTTDLGMMHEVMVYNHTLNKGNTSLVIADSGKIRLTPDKANLIFTLYDGTSYEEENILKPKDTSFTLRKINFTEQEVIIPLDSYAFKKSEDSKYSSQVMTKSLQSLQKDRDSLESANNKVLANQVRRATRGSYLKHSSQLDSIANSRLKGVFPYDSLFKWKSLQQELDAYNMANTGLNDQLTNVKFFENELLQTAFPLRRTIIESYRKFTLSLACFIFFFIGAPLGAIIRKGGLGTPAIISIFFFVIYWVVDISGKKLANDGAVAPFIGTFISTFVLMPIGAFLTWKSTRDSSLFNIDAYTNFIKKLFSKAKKIKTRK